MRKLLTYTSIPVVTGVMLLSMLFVPGPVFAQNASTTPASTEAPAANANSATNVPAPDTSKDCGLLNPGQCVMSAVATVTIGLANFLLGIAGTLFNWVVIKTVFQFSTFIGNTPTLLTIWGIFRDIGNIIILFGFIFMGMATLLELQSFSMKKALPSLLVFAVLLNFSLFISEAVIDVSNVLSSTIYAQANTDPCNDEKDCNVNFGIAGHIMQTTGLARIHDVEAGSASQFADKLWIVLILALFATVGTFVLLAASIMLIIRAVMLTFLMIVAPIGFAGMAIPPFKKMAAAWREKLIHQAFYAPILLLFIFVSLKIADGYGGASGNAGLSSSLAEGLANPSVGAMGTIMLYTLSMGFLIGSLIFASKFGAAGASFAANSAAKVAFGLPNLLTQGAARTGRFAIQNTRFGSTGAGRFATSLLRPIEKGAADVRRIPVISSTLKRAGAGAAAQRTDSLSKFNETVNIPERLRRGNVAETKLQNKELADIKSGREKDALMQAARTGNLTDEQKKLLARKSTTDLEEMPGIKGGKGDDPATQRLVQSLQSDQYSKLMASENLTSAQKGELAKARYAELQTAAAAAKEANDRGDKDTAAKHEERVGEILKKSDKKTLAGMPADLIISDAVLNKLTDKQREDLVGDDALTREVRDKVKASNPIEIAVATFDTGGADALLAPRPDGGKSIYTSMTREQIVKLPKKILLQEKIIDQYKANVLASLSEEKGKFTPEELVKIGDRIKTRPAGDPARQYVEGFGSIIFS